MKYKNKEYAKALVALMEEKKGESDQKKMIDGFLKILQKNGDFKKAREILSLAEHLHLKKTGNKKITLETARETNNASVVKHIFKKGDKVEEKINPKIIAGITIVIDNEKQLDFSLKRKLEEIFT